MQRLEAFPNRVKVAVSEEAADTMIEPVSFTLAVEVVPADPVEVPQAVRMRAGVDEHGDDKMRETKGPMHGAVHPGGTSMITLVDFDDSSGEIAFFELEVVDGFPSEERDDPESSGADLDDGR